MSDTQTAAEAHHAELHEPGRYCDRCGARLKGDGAWGHDNDCPKRSA